MTTFQELRSAVHAQDKTAVLNILKEYTDSLEDIDPLRYISDNWGYVPASSWDNNVDSSEQYRSASALALVNVHVPMTAFVNLKGRSIQIAQWDDYHSVLYHHVFPLRQACFAHLQEHHAHLVTTDLTDMLALLQYEIPLHSAEDIKLQSLKRAHEHLRTLGYGALLSDTPVGVIGQYSILFGEKFYTISDQVDASVLKEYYALNS